MEEKDEISVKSVEKIDQVSFWSLTFAFMLKLIAVGMTISALPFNEWIVMEQRRADGIIVLRGVSGSDCILENKDSKEINCIHWSEDDRIIRGKFWRKWSIPESSVNEPSTFYKLMFYLIIFQCVAFFVDLGITFFMCYRYKLQKDKLPREKRLALMIFDFILFIYLIVILTIFVSSGSFIDEKFPFQSHLGVAFKLYFAAFLIFFLSFVLVNASRIVVARTERVEWKTIASEIFCADFLIRCQRQHRELRTTESIQLSRKPELS